MLDTVDLDLVAGVLAEEDAVALLHLQRVHAALVVRLATADRDDLALGGLFLGRIRNDDAALRLLFLGDAANNNAIMQWANFHRIFASVLGRSLAVPVWECQW